MLGMLGGGQLGRYFVIAARKLGYRVTVLDPDPDSPAACMADRHLVADFKDPQALDEIAATCAAVSTEFENVPAASLARLAASLRVAPSAECVAIRAGPDSRERLLPRQRPAGGFVTRAVHRAAGPGGCRRVPGRPQARALRVRRQGPGARRQPRRGGRGLGGVRASALRPGSPGAVGPRGLGGAGACRGRRGAGLSRGGKPAHQRHPRRVHRAGTGPGCAGRGGGTHRLVTCKPRWATSARWAWSSSLSGGRLAAERDRPASAQQRPLHPSTPARATNSSSSCARCAPCRLAGRACAGAGGHGQPAGRHLGRRQSHPIGRAYSARPVRACTCTARTSPAPGGKWVISRCSTPRATRRSSGRWPCGRRWAFPMPEAPAAIDKAARLLRDGRLVAFSHRDGLWPGRGCIPVPPPWRACTPSRGVRPTIR